MAHNKPERLLPPRWLQVILALLGGAVVWLQFSDGVGDIGMNNVFCYMAVVLGAILYGLWFLFGSGQSLVVKLGAVFGVFAAGSLIAATVRFEGWSGSMVPVVHYVWDKPEERLVSAGGTGLPEVVEAAGLDLVTSTEADFPGFLGPDRNATIGGVRLATDWSAHPPEILWRIPIGKGWSGFSVVNGVALTHEEEDGQEHVVARDVRTGAELWRHSYPASFDHPLGGPGPHATPTIAGGMVFAQGAQGLLLCLDGKDGALLWEQNLRSLYGATDAVEAATVQYGRSASPLVYKDAVIMPAGGDPEGKHPGVVGFDRMTGELLWEGPPRAISHASPSIATLQGVEQLLVVNEDTVSAHDPADGRLLWEHDWPGSTAGDANNSQPLVVGDGKVLLTKGYGQGALLLSVTQDANGNWSAEQIWAQRRSLRTKLTNAVHRDGHAYGLSDGMLECISLGDGRRVWKEGRFGHGQLLLVEDVLLLLSEEGELLLISASPDGQGEVLARMPILEGKTWNTIALYGDLALVRNGQEAAAVRLPTRSDS